MKLKKDFWNLRIPAAAMEQCVIDSIPGYQNVTKNQGTR
jgi:hypothetical protein